MEASTKRPNDEVRSCRWGMARFHAWQTFAIYRAVLLRPYARDCYALVGATSSFKESTILAVISVKFPARTIKPAIGLV